MSLKFTALPPAVKQQIQAQNAIELPAHHMPVFTYSHESKVRADKLQKVAAEIKTIMRIDVAPLATESMLCAEALEEADIAWVNSEEERSSECRFWYKNKPALYEKNHELYYRLRTVYALHPNPARMTTLEEIGTSDNDGDAINDGLRYMNIFDIDGNIIEASGVYTATEMDGIKEFYDEISKARVHADSDRNSLDPKRILRDQIYLHQRILEQRIMAIVEGAFVGQPKKIAEFQSAYYRRNNSRKKDKSTAPVVSA